MKKMMLFGCSLLAAPALHAAQATITTERAVQPAPLADAVAKADVNTVITLLHNHVDLHALDRYGQSPFMIACQDYSVLCDSSNMHNETPRSPLFLKKIHKAELLRIIIMELIAEHRARDENIDLRDNDGNTKLMHAVFEMALHETDDFIIQQLLNAGADINAKNNNGNTALLQIAGMPNRGKIVQKLVALGADHLIQDQHGLLARDHADFHRQSLQAFDAAVQAGLKERSILLAQKQFTEIIDEDYIVVTAQTDEEKKQ